MARQLSEPVRTFTVGFDYQHDELQSAADTAARLGCRHTEISCRAEDVELLPKIVWHLDEPLGDPITIPMFQLAHEAKKQVTVILAGEGADETLGGYLSTAPCCAVTSWLAGYLARFGARYWSPPWRSHPLPS